MLNTRLSGLLVQFDFIRSGGLPGKIFDTGFTNVPQFIKSHLQSSGMNPLRQKRTVSLVFVFANLGRANRLFHEYVGDWLSIDISPRKIEPVAVVFEIAVSFRDVFESVFSQDHPDSRRVLFVHLINAESELYYVYSLFLTDPGQ